MVVSWLEIVDTAVKIGLGALISGAAALWLARLSHVRELHKELTKRRRDALESIAEKIQRTHVLYANIVQTGIQITAKSGAASLAKTPVKGTIFENVPSLIDDFASSESRLLLLGEQRAAELLMDFGNQIMGYVEVLGQGKQPQDNAAEVRTLQTKLFEELSKAYRS